MYPSPLNSYFIWLFSSVLCVYLLWMNARYRRLSAHKEDPFARKMRELESWLPIHQKICSINRDGGEKEVVEFAERCIGADSSLIKHIYGVSCREIARYLVNLVYYYPSMAKIIANDMFRNMDKERQEKVMHYIRRNKAHPESGIELIFRIREKRQAF